MSAVRLHGEGPGCGQLVQSSRRLKEIRCGEIQFVPQAERDHGVAARQIGLSRKALRNVEVGIRLKAIWTRQTLVSIPIGEVAVRVFTRVRRFRNTGCVRKQQIVKQISAVAIEASTARTRVGTADVSSFTVCRANLFCRNEFGAVGLNKTFAVRVEPFLPHHGAWESRELAEPPWRSI